MTDHDAATRNEADGRMPMTPHEWKELYLGEFPSPNLDDLIRRIGVGLPQTEGLAMRREAFRQARALTAERDQLRLERDELKKELKEARLQIECYEIELERP